MFILQHAVSNVDGIANYGAICQTVYHFAIPHCISDSSRAISSFIIALNNTVIIALNNNAKNTCFHDKENGAFLHFIVKIIHLPARFTQSARRLLGISQIFQTNSKIDVD